MEIEKEQNGAQIIFRLPERLDTIYAGELEEILEKTSMDGIDELIFDMTETVYISSLGLRVMMMTALSLEKEGKKFVLRNVEDNCRTILRTMGLLDMFIIQ